MEVRLGNTAAIERGEGVISSAGGEDPEDVAVLGGQRVTTVSFPEDVKLGDALTTITGPGGIWATHSAEPPAWVESDSEGLEALLAEHYGCERGAPDDLEETHHTDAGPPGIGPDHEGTFVGEGEETPEDDR